MIAVRTLVMAAVTLRMVTHAERELGQKKKSSYQVSLHHPLHLSVAADLLLKRDYRYR